jgi:hypothetical protein
MRAKHQALFEKFTKKFMPATVEKWEKMVSDWETDHSKLNPYEELEIGK